MKYFVFKQLNNDDMCTDPHMINILCWFSPDLPLQVRDITLWGSRGLKTEDTDEPGHFYLRELVAKRSRPVTEVGETTLLWDLATVISQKVMPSLEVENLRLKKILVHPRMIKTLTTSTVHWRSQRQVRQSAVSAPSIFHTALHWVRPRREGFSLIQLWHSNQPIPL